MGSQEEPGWVGSPEEEPRMDRVWRRSPDGWGVRGGALDSGVQGEEAAWGVRRGVLDGESRGGVLDGGVQGQETWMDGESLGGTQMDGKYRRGLNWVQERSPRMQSQGKAG